MNTTSKLLLSRVLLLLTFGWSTAFSVNNIVEPKTFSPNVKNHGIVSSAFASAAVPAAALAAVEDGVELAELPPPIVPIIFAIGLIVGVGLLTSSLGDVYSEEAALGLQSGAQAKKERERSRSSYFKKR